MKEIMRWLLSESGAKLFTPFITMQPFSCCFPILSLKWISLFAVMPNPNNDIPLSALLLITVSICFLLILKYFQWAAKMNMLSCKLIHSAILDALCSCVYSLGEDRNTRKLYQHKTFEHSPSFANFSKWNQVNTAFYCHFLCTNTNNCWI